MVSFQEAVAAGKLSTEEASALFDSLPTVTVQEMLGLWKGESFQTGHPMDGYLEGSGWFGKRFTGDNNVDPLVYTAKEGGHFNVDPVLIRKVVAEGKMPADARSECEAEKPKARLRMVEYRGKSTGSMVYNEVPTIDHFRKADEGVLLGVMDDINSPVPPFFFILRLTKEVS